jgi:hypothetical protein
VKIIFGNPEMGVPRKREGCYRSQARAAALSRGRRPQVEGQRIDPAEGNRYAPVGRHEEFLRRGLPVQVRSQADHRPAAVPVSIAGS